MAWCTLLLFIVGCFAIRVQCQKQPNIVVILADDLGWNDVAYHGSNQYPTPNIDALAYYGIMLQRAYVHPMCTPSRAAFLTGKNAVRLGMQSLVLFSAEARGLPLNETLLPQHLKRLGYKTHLRGKWHLGMYKKEYTPLYRGFDSFVGYLTGHQDYYDHTAQENDPDPIYTAIHNYTGFDMWRGENFAFDLVGKYTTDVITEEALSIIENHCTSKPLYLQLSHLASHAGNAGDPLQAPADVIEKFSYISDPKRRAYAAITWKLDESIGAVINKLEEKGILDNTIVIFSSDNGGTRSPIENNVGSNWPLRGEKSTVWEGGVRAAAAIWSPLLKNMKKISSDIIEITDWLPTLYTAAGGDASDLGDIDGINIWDNLVNGTPSPRKEVLHNIDPTLYSESITIGNWKYVNGGSYLGTQDDIYGATGRDPEYAYDPELVVNSVAANVFQKYTDQPLTSEEVLAKRDLATVKCSQPFQKPKCKAKACVFNVELDPCEQLDVSNLMKDTQEISTLTQRLAYWKNRAAKPGNLPWDERANPKNWNNTWTNWGDLLGL